MINDYVFLQALDKLHLRTQFAKITLLSFSEKPIKEIQGTIISGSLNVNGASAIRRTINLSINTDQFTSKIDNIDNEISINKKVKIEIGIKNILPKYQEQYGDIVWFPCGIFVLSQASVTKNTNNWTISIQGKDKMVQLDGTVGGMIPALTVFHEKRILLDDEENYLIQEVPIFQIIYEAVNQLGGEAPENIIINDIDDQVKLLVKYRGANPIYFATDYSSFSFSYDPVNFPNPIVYQQDTGYEMTDFTYPGELILNAGDSVVTLLDKIAKTLGNFEFFYDLDGRFVFQEIRNYLNKQSPLDELREEDYLQTYDNKKFLYNLTDFDTITSITKSPKYENIKNDFYVWGVRKVSNDIEVDICYHLAIDKKPTIELANKYMWAVISDDDLIIRYDFNDVEDGYEVQDYHTKKVSVPCGEWREELYRRALNAQVTNSVYSDYYDSELIKNWRDLYNPMDESWRNGWNPAIYNDPGSINYWLDFIGEDSDLGKYSISEIGRRTKVSKNDKIKTVYNNRVPDLVFIENDENREEKIRYYDSIGQKWFLLTEQYFNLFSISSTGKSCFDEIRELIYYHLNYNTSIQIQCLPKYYIEPNTIIHIEDKESGIIGNYQITSFSLPLAYNGTMTINATEVLNRI